VPSKLSGLEPALADQAASVNDLTLQQLCAWLHAEHGIQVGITAMGKASARLGLSLKKIAPCGRANASRRSAGTSSLAGRAAWRSAWPTGVS
jgi:transposase